MKWPYYRTGIGAYIVPLYLAFFLGQTASLGAQAFVPFVVSDGLSPESPLYVHSQPIATDSPRIVAENGHFYLDGERIRIWGANTTFSANLPTHEQAPGVARRIASMGINSIRIHHLDTSQYPRGIWTSGTGENINTTALDRLDYFFAQLAENGVYVNLNLHVGRKHSDYLDIPDPGTSYDKIAAIFTPEIIQAQKEYAAAMLDHVNPYRGVRYADDPAIAFVEITNEDSFFMWNGEETLQNLPTYYDDLLRSQYNEWLTVKYGDDSALNEAWSAGVDPPGENMLENSGFLETSTPGGAPLVWRLEEHETAEADFSTGVFNSYSCGIVTINQITSSSWHVQMNQPGLSVEAGKFYTLIFTAAASEVRDMTVSLMMAHSPWSQLGFSRTVQLRPEWQTFTFGFVPSQTDDNARINFTLGNDTSDVFFNVVLLSPGGEQALLPGESLTDSSVALYADLESAPRATDRNLFLAEREKAFFEEMGTTVREDLGCDALIAGTIVFGSLGMYAQSGLDFLDGHAYWQHPSFPGRPWDPNNWLVRQRAMTDEPENATLFSLASQRLTGRPFTVSEYNHPAPNDFQAECVPMVASFGAAHDWDAIWLFTYTNDAADFLAERFDNYFAMNENPGKWGFVRSGAEIFRHSAIPPVGVSSPVVLNTQESYLEDLVSLQRSFGRSMEDALGAVEGITWQDFLTDRYHSAFTDSTPTSDPLPASSTQMQWTVEGGEGVYAVQSDSAWVFTGRTGRFAEATGDVISVLNPGFAAVTVTSLNKKPLSESRQILISACGRSENVDMAFSADRETLIGNDWGDPPAQIEAVTAILKLPPGRWLCHALDSEGLPKMEVALTVAGQDTFLNMDPFYGTMWYLLTQKDDASISGNFQVFY